MESEAGTTATAASTSNEKGEHQKWFPLESNPTLMNDYISTLGWDTTQYHVVDVYSTDDWALEMIAQPVVAVLLLYPLTSVQLQYEKEEKEKLEKEGNKKEIDSNKIWFIKQRIGNACGTIGLLHAMMNVAIQNQNQFLIQPNSWLEQFLKKTTSASTSDDESRIITPDTDPITIAEILETDPTIASYHDSATSSTANATSRGDIDDDIITHFIAFIRNPSPSSSDTNSIIELDGRKSQPIVHQIPVSKAEPPSTTNVNLLSNACAVIRDQFMKRDPNEIRFTILALSINTSSENDDE